MDRSSTLVGSWLLNFLWLCEKIVCFNHGEPEVSSTLSGHCQRLAVRSTGGAFCPPQREGWSLSAEDHCAEKYRPTEKFSVSHSDCYWRGEKIIPNLWLVGSMHLWWRLGMGKAFCAREPQLQWRMVLQVWNHGWRLHERNSSRWSISGYAYSWLHINSGSKLECHSEILPPRERHWRDQTTGCILGTAGRGFDIKDRGSSDKGVDSQQCWFQRKINRIDSDRQESFGASP